jgi:hypothetical protein
MLIIILLYHTTNSLAYSYVLSFLVIYFLILRRFKEETNILHTIKWRKDNLIGHILRRNCLLKHVIDGKIEGRIEVPGDEE